MQVGAVHRYDPCQPADKQAANFVTTVPRDPKLLPPAVELDMLADDCPVKVSDAAVESELMTFLNQIETHTGKPAILKVSPSFEERYAMPRRSTAICGWCAIASSPTMPGGRGPCGRRIPI